MEEYKIKKLEKSDIKQVIDIWNDVVIDGVAFPQTELLNDWNFLILNRLPVWLIMLKQMKLSDFIFCIQIMLAGADIFQMQVMP